MTNYASGKHSQAICDRCCWKYKYLTIRKEWTCLKVCPFCFESKHPQLDPIDRIFDPQALDDPRPDNDDVGDTIQLNTLTNPTFGETL